MSGVTVQLLSMRGLLEDTLHTLKTDVLIELVSIAIVRLTMDEHPPVLGQENVCSWFQTTAK